MPLQTHLEGFVFGDVSSAQPAFFVPEWVFVKRLLAALLFAGGCALAQPLMPESGGLIHTSVLSPFGQLPISEGCRIGFNFSIANEQSYDTGNWGEMGIDAEVWTLQPTIRTVTPAGEFGVAVPITYVWGGLMDAPLDVYHQVIRLNRIVNPERGRSLAYYKLSTGEERIHDQPAFGLGDPTLSWAYPLDDFFVKATLGIPVGRREQFIGAGAWKSSVQMGYGTASAGVMGQVG